MASIMIGSLMVKLPETGITTCGANHTVAPPREIMAPIVPKLTTNASRHLSMRQFSAACINEYDAKVASAFAHLDAKCSKRHESFQYGHVVKVKQWRTITPCSDKVRAKRIKKEQEEAERTHWRMSGDASGLINAHSCIYKGATGTSESLRSPFYRRTPKKACIKNQAKKQLHLSSKSIELLIASCAKIARNNNSRIETRETGKRSGNHVTFSKRNGITIPILTLNHMIGRISRVDVKPNGITDVICKHLAIAVDAVGELGPGDSGSVLKLRDANTFLKYKNSNIFILRGMCTGMYVDARTPLTRRQHQLTKDFTADKFWRGFEGKFLRERPNITTHVCTSNFDVTRCGEVAALCTQAVYPCGRITCQACSNEFCKQTHEEILNATRSKIEKSLDDLDENYSEFPHAKRLLEAYLSDIPHKNPNLASYTKVADVIGDITSAPFNHITTLNKILVKGGKATESDYGVASDALLSIARYIKNRTDSIKHGELKHFRNKVSAKTHYNADLFCDNQRDANGNFQWGMRGEHAKRFFSTYFNKIDPVEGYSEFEMRKSRDGKRKTAIGKLLFSTNYEVFRDQMMGEPIAKQALTIECTSTNGSSFVYPCCCVTDDMGNPIESRFEYPTKHHIVIGNAGDAKYVELPKRDDNLMYIAKDGYCYIHIFLAMLINVPEHNAKDFTKWTRDNIITKLGEWPTLLDVATACNQLAILYPDTMSAEMPRILVDHNTKCMHVLDSYGSISTGYHILKANTIAQFIQFARTDVISSMSAYTVGGETIPDDEDHTTTMDLIRSVFNPQKMEKILTEDPMKLIMAMMSPSVILALFNSGSLEKAMNYWIRRDQDVTQIATMLTLMASKVSCSKIISEQLKVLEESAADVLKVVERVNSPFHTKARAQCLLMRMQQNRGANDELMRNGFEIFHEVSNELLEKIYQEAVQAQYAELSWLERLSLTNCSRKQRKKYSNIHSRIKLKDISDKSKGYIQTSLGKASDFLRRKRIAVRSKVSDIYYRSIGKIFCKVISSARFISNDLTKFVNVLLIMQMLLSIFGVLYKHTSEFEKLKQLAKEVEADRELDQIDNLYSYAVKERGADGISEEEFLTFLKKHSSALYDRYMQTFINSPVYKFQAKSKGEAHLEKVIATVALVLMIVDAERSDCVYKVLNKLKSLMSTATQDAYQFQSVDDIQHTLEDKKLTIDFEIDQENDLSRVTGATFSQWWSNQLMNNNVIAHYRTEGHYMEFTRATSTTVANSIAHGDHKDILLMGAVGSGKSTGLPAALSQKGRVLLIEPTRPLAENVFQQLKKDPFQLNPSLRMRGTTAFGSSPIMIMTSGYALHYYANNAHLLSEYEFIIIDECHVHDANAIAFRCCLKEHDFQGKILKVSATIPGRESNNFTTQHAVNLIKEDSLSFSQFVQNQGTNCNSDILGFGDNILIYVASYNEVDQLSKMLTDKGHRVTKVDGRTMKLGQINIETKGTPTQKHFIVATNIIENGVTLDVDTVVDFGMKVCPELDAEARMIRYQKIPISYGERVQRLGRVGRHKAGTALRIGSTEKGIQKVPPLVATEAAFLCFTYGFPVMTDGVTTSLLSNCTVPQARTMQNFELTPFFTSNLVKYDGSMHPVMHNILKPYKLRESDILLSKLAIPHAGLKMWFTAREMNRHGVKLNLDENTRIPFYARDIPEKLIQDVHDATVKHKTDAGFGKISAHSACKIAYTLQVDPSSIQRTIACVDKLIECEQQKHSYFQNALSSSASKHSFSLSSLMNSIRTMHIKDNTAANIQTLQAAKSQLLEFKCKSIDLNAPETYEDFGALECMTFQSAEQISNFLQLKGHWNTSLLTNDLIVVGGALFGGAWMMYSYFTKKIEGEYEFQGANKRTRSKYKFRQAYDNKHKFEVEADPDTINEYFGSAYLKKGKKGGTTKGMGAKTRRFYNMYGFDPTEYNFARYVDPLTGHTLDEQPIADIHLISDHFLKIRRDYVANDLIDSQALKNNQKIEVYFVKNLAKQVLKIDMTPHNSMRVCDKFETISGYPEREGELRQSGAPQMVAASSLPAQKEDMPDDLLSFESKSQFHGLRDYNPISTVVCQLDNDSDGVSTKVFGIGFGNVIITNQHLFKRNNGELRIRSHHGEFTIKNTTGMHLHPVPERDIILIKLPKDCPPFPQKLKFREAEGDERVCMVGTNFQTRSISSTVSDVSSVVKFGKTNFFKHWITTTEGQCGLPLVATRDGYIVGIHSMANTNGGNNMFVGFPNDFHTIVQKEMDTLAWVKGWKLNLALANWGAINILNTMPTKLFNLSKDIASLDDVSWSFQAHEKRWLFSQLSGNLKAVATTPSNFVTKHVVKGKCPLFSVFLNTNKEASDYFTGKLGAYQKSALNKDAYIKDVMKYAGVIRIGELDCDTFEKALTGFIGYLERENFHKVNYITDHNEIFDSLNMKAAVGALYTGKKRDYFSDFTEDDKMNIVKDSCERLYKGHMGIWNGSLKPELRPIEKVLANKTRTFTAAPIDSLLGGKVCVDDFNNQFYSRNLSLPWSVGMTKFYGGWDKLLNGLPDGWLYCDADGSRFDSSLSPYLINAVLKIRLHFMEEWEIGERMLENFYTEIVYTPIATPDGTIVKKFKGNNSGQPSTVVDNTLMVILAMKYSILLFKTDEPEEDFCRYYVNGDDLLIAVRPDCESFLDNLRNTFEQLGLDYDFSSRTKDKSQLWFMSHQGKIIDGLFIPKLEEERIISILEWDRAKKPEHRLEAICAAMIEAWGHTELLHWIRVFYLWVLEQAPYNELAKIGAAPYISEAALRKLYTDKNLETNEIQQYVQQLTDIQSEPFDDDDVWEFQANESEIDAGKELATKKAAEEKKLKRKDEPDPTPDRDVNAGTSGTFSVPKVKALSSKMRLPKINGKTIINLDHLLEYNPDQVDISNTRASKAQFEAWYTGVKNEYELTDQQMEIVLNGFMVWCIDNGTSPNLSGNWTMMDGEEQVEYPLKPMLEHAKPTLRQIMAHFSNIAEAYIAKRNMTQLYIPRYATQRNLTDLSLAMVAFDFYEVTSKTSNRAREAHHQMKAAALHGVKSQLFGLDGKVGTQAEDTERHTAHDVNRNMHTISGAQL